MPLHFQPLRSMWEHGKKVKTVALTHSTWVCKLQVAMPRTVQTRELGHLAEQTGIEDQCLESWQSIDVKQTSPKHLATKNYELLPVKEGLQVQFFRNSDSRTRFQRLELPTQFYTGSCMQTCSMNASAI